MSSRCRLGVARLSFFPWKTSVDCRPPATHWDHINCLHHMPFLLNPSLWLHSQSPMVAPMRHFKQHLDVQLSWQSGFRVGQSGLWQTQTRSAQTMTLKPQMQTTMTNCSCTSNSIEQSLCHNLSDRHPLPKFTGPPLIPHKMFSFEELMSWASSLLAFFTHLTLSATAALNFCWWRRFFLGLPNVTCARNMVSSFGGRDSAAEASLSHILSVWWHSLGAISEWRKVS